MPDAIDVGPRDEYNERLLNNVHPHDWANPKPASRYNLVVIGAGTAGLVAAAGAAGLGAKVALVERHLLGGDCLNTGCVPSKALIRSSRAAADARNSGQYGIRAGGDVKVDFAAVMERVRRVRSGISDNDSAERFRGLGVDVFLGDGRFSGPDTVQAGDSVLRFKKAVIATGARPVHPPIPGLEKAGFLTNETVFSLVELPRRLAVIGGGPIGCELAQAFGRLGSQVTIVEMGVQFLPREDPDAARILAAALERDGIKVLLGAEIKQVQSFGSEKRLLIEAAGEALEIETDELLVGVGRAPNVQGLNLEVVGVKYDTARGIWVNDRLQTTNRRIFAAGDVAMQHKFTHAADAAARIVIQNALFMGRKKLSALIIPWTTYTDPEIAHVGLNEKSACDAGLEIDTFTRNFSDVDRAVADGEEQGLLKIHVKKGTDRIVGATIAARHAGEMLSEITTAMAAGMGLGALSGVIHPYPTQAEAIKHVADAYNRSRLTPGLKSAFTRWLSWTR